MRNRITKLTERTHKPHLFRQFGAWWWYSVHPEYPYTQRELMRQRNGDAMRWVLDKREKGQ